MKDYRKKFNEMIGNDLTTGENPLIDIAQGVALDYSDKIRALVKDTVETTIAEYSMYVAVDMYTNLLNEYINWLSRQNFNTIELELGKWVAKDLRNTIYRENQEEILKLLDQDNLVKIKDLEEKLEKERSYNRY